MPEQARVETAPERLDETQVVDEPTADSESADREVVLSDIDQLLDEIDAVLNSEEQQALDEARARAEFKAKLKSLSLVGRSALDPCLESGLVRVPEVVAERLLSAGLAREHECRDCD